jgi:hypothetical protein
MKTQATASRTPRTRSSKKTATSSVELPRVFALEGSIAQVLEREHERLMRMNLRTVTWARSTANDLPPRVRAAIADVWRATMESEHRSAGIFATFVLDLMGAGAPHTFLSIASRATLDEVRHAELSARLASLYSRRPETPTPGIPRVPDEPGLTAHELALHQTLFLSVGAETFSSIMLADSLEHARDPVVRQVLSIILSDEMHHARLGWGYLAHLLDAPSSAEWSRAFVRDRLVGIFEVLHRSLFDDPEKLPAPSLRGRASVLAEEHGYRPARVQYELFHHAIRDVWIPAFHKLGFDLTVLAHHFPAPSWMGA